MRKSNKNYIRYIISISFLIKKKNGGSGQQAIRDHKAQNINFFHICTCILLNHLFILELLPCCSFTSQPTVSGYQIILAEIKRNVLPKKDTFI